MSLFALPYETGKGSNEALNSKMILSRLAPADCIVHFCTKKWPTCTNLSGRQTRAYLAGKEHKDAGEQWWESWRPLKPQHISSHLPSPSSFTLTFYKVHLW
jgi:hypothetical protein